MHTGQIVFLTKIYAPGTIHFYEDATDDARAFVTGTTAGLAATAGRFVCWCLSRPAKPFGWDGWCKREGASEDARQQARMCIFIPWRSSRAAGRC